MCLITDRLDPIITTEDMVVYKLMKHIKTDYGIDVVTPYERFLYEINKLYKTEITETCDRCYFDNVAGIYYEELLRKDCEIKSFEEGFHSAKTIERLKTNELTSGICFNNIKIHKCIVPAGSIYYEDGTDLIVSNQIIITK